MKDNDAIATVLAILMIAITLMVCTSLLTTYSYELEVKDNHLIQTGRLYKNCLKECDRAIPDDSIEETLECLKSCNFEIKCIIEEI